MAGPGQQRPPVVEPITPQDGAGTRNAVPATRHCPICGQDAPDDGSVPERFGEAFCYAAHTEEFVSAVRRARVQAATQNPAEGVERGCATLPGVAVPRNWKAVLGKALCWGGPLAAIVILLGGGLLAQASAALSCRCWRSSPVR